MISRNFLKTTSSMIYIGTALVSILSFFTTLHGLKIVVGLPLAIIGSLGLQAAMLGIAWNLIGLKENRTSFISVFCITAVFSIFFSFINFDINLRTDVRAIEARNQFARDGRIALDERSRIAKDALAQGHYQVERLGDLIELERAEGWATLVDEGSKDVFVQSVIDGARLTVDSWSKRKGREYQQGKGRGLIINYLESRVQQSRSTIERIEMYIPVVDSVSMALNGRLEIIDQSYLVNQVTTQFPASEISLILGKRLATPPPPPDPGQYSESAENAQHALSLAIMDLVNLDRTAFFALILAIAIDLITLLIALAGSQTVKTFESTHEVIDRIGQYAQSRLKRVSLDNPESFWLELEENLRRFEVASEYTASLRALSETLDPENLSRRTTLKRKAETTEQETTTETPTRV